MPFGRDLFQLAVCSALLLSSAQGRTLQQGSNVVVTTTPAAAPATALSAASPWTNYTRESNTLKIGISVLEYGITASDEECASICNLSGTCVWFAWCPADETAGCGIPAANATISSIVPAGGCYATWDNVAGRRTFFVAKGEAVAFISGEYRPTDGTSARSSSGARRLQQADVGASGVWINYTRTQHVIYLGLDVLPGIAAQTAEECASACNADAVCFFWALCPPAVGASGCEVVSFTPNAPPQIVPAGTCLLSYDVTRNQLAYLDMSGDGVTFESGWWNGTGPRTPPPPASPGPSGLPWNGSTPGTVTTNTSTAPGVVPPLSPGTVSPAPIPPTTSISMAPANASNQIIFTYSTSLAAGSCPEYNGTASGFLGVSESSRWAASAKPAAINWDKVLELNWRLCANRSDVVPTLLAAFAKPGSEEANTAVAATQLACADGYGIELLYLMAASPPDDNSDGSLLASYGEAWLRAADAAGYFLCIAIGQFDSPGAVVAGTERFVHNAMPWSGSGSPGYTGVAAHWNLPKQGQPTTCLSWDGTDFSAAGAKEWPGTVASPAAVNQSELEAYVTALCATPEKAAPTLAAAIASGDNGTASLAALGTLYTCNGNLRLDGVLADVVTPHTSLDWQRSINLAKAWVAAFDRVGYPFCVTIASYENGLVVNGTQVHPGGETPGLGATLT